MISCWCLSIQCMCFMSSGHFVWYIFTLWQLCQGVDSLAQWLEHWIFNREDRVRFPGKTDYFFSYASFLCYCFRVVRVSKLAANPRNSACDCVFNPKYERFYNNKPTAIKPLGLRVQPLLEEANINIKNIQPFSFPSKDPWTLNPPKIILDLHKNKKIRSWVTYF